jgi:hypothetical protein
MMMMPMQWNQAWTTSPIDEELEIKEGEDPDEEANFELSGSNTNMALLIYELYVLYLFFYH